MPAIREAKFQDLVPGDDAGAGPDEVESEVVQLRTCPSLRAERGKLTGVQRPGRGEVGLAAEAERDTGPGSLSAGDAGSAGVEQLRCTERLTAGGQPGGIRVGEGGSLCAVGGDRVVAAHDVRGAGHEGQGGDGSADGQHRQARAAAAGAVWTRGSGVTGDRSRGPWPTRQGVSWREPV